MANEDGLITEAMAEENFWYSDGYADYIRHFLAGMGSVPGGAPPGDDHLLRSTSVGRSVAHLPDEIRYQTFDKAATEVLRLAFTPRYVHPRAKKMPRRANPAAE